MTLEEVRTKVREAAQAYYDGNSIMSDAAYDSLTDLLRLMNPNDSLLQKVGNGYSIKGIEEKEKFYHPIEVGTIDKVKEFKELVAWLKPGATFSTKLDGNSISGYLQDQNLTDIATRGEENVGINRTGKFEHLFPVKIDEPALAGRYVSVKGEAVIPKNLFTTANGFDIEKSSRNSVAGAITRKDNWKSVFKFVEFIAYTFTDCDTGEDLYNLINWKDYFTVEDQKPVGVLTKERLEEIKQTYKIGSKYDADGIVFKNPDGSMKAFKFEDETIVTELQNIEWTVGKDQRLTPVAIIRAVNICGATVDRASIGSFAKALEKRVWPVKATHEVRVKRANEVIPHLIETTFSSSEASPIQKIIPLCPACGQAGHRNGEHIFCINPDCKNIDESRLYNFAEFYYPADMGDSLAEKFFDAYGLKTVADLLNFNQKITKEIDGVGDAKQILLETFLENLKNPIEAKILYNVFVLGCGDSGSEKIVDCGFDIGNFVNGDSDLEINKLRKLSNFNSNIIKQMNLKKPELAEIYGLRTITQTKKQKGNVVGTFCITKARFKDDQKTKIESLGWYEDKTVKKTTTVLVTKDPNAVTDKTETAKKFGIKIMSIEQFLTFIER